MVSNRLVEFDCEIPNQAVWWSKWCENRKSYFDGLIKSLEVAITQAEAEIQEVQQVLSPCSGESGLIDTDKFNRASTRKSILETLKRDSKELETTRTPRNIIQHIVETLEKRKELWVGTSLLDQPLFWIKKLVTLVSPKKSAFLFKDHYSVLKNLTDHVKSTNKFIR